MSYKWKFPSPQFTGRDIAASMLCVRFSFYTVYYFVINVTQKRDGILKKNSNIAHVVIESKFQYRVFSSRPIALL